MDQLTFHGATISFDDASLTGKVLEYLAGQQGVKPSDVANQAKAIVPFMLTQLNNPELMKALQDRRDETGAATPASDEDAEDKA